ncbi:MAG: cyclodeaminase/cyclohydrolase family protein [Desulfobacca sp.]|nr:cyclodeaminase/cyclohydrolase family protein [Desulfobacca sp.]
MESPGFPQWPIQTFVERLAQGNPLPGGGCALALAGALAAALGGLATQLSLKNPQPEGDIGSVAQLLEEVEAQQAAFLELLDADALAYQAVVQAQRLPRQNADQHLTRRLARDAAFLQACEPPLEMAARGLALLQGASLLAARGNPVTLADVGVMACLAEAVVHGALINVFSNLSMLQNAALSLTVRDQARHLQEQLEDLGPRLRSALYGQVLDRPEPSRRNPQK